MLGRKLLRGQIPVVPPHLIRCPVPPEYVKDFEQYCQDFQAGKLSESDVMSKVSEHLKSLKKTEPEKPVGESGNT